MKKNLIISLCLITSILAFGQEITGDWNAALKVQGMQLRLVFHIVKSDTSYTTTMDSPDQGATGIPMTSTTYKNSILTVEMAAANIKYVGTLDKSGEIVGTFNQAGQSFPLNFSKKVIAKVEIKRPQEPIKPYPYYSEEVTFVNKKDNITLAGTLTLPKNKGKFPVVVLITGSGPQNRDEELMGHKPFLVLSDFLTRNGIGVLRYDDRGSFASKGNFAKATSFDFENDAEAAVNYLKMRKNVDPKKIGMIGHSEGGIIAPMVAARNKDVSFIVLMAGPGISGADILVQQQELIGRASGVKEEELKKIAGINETAYKLISSIADTITLRHELTEYLTQKVKDLPKNGMPAGTPESIMVSGMVAQLTSPWMIKFISYNPAPTLEKVTCPVLALIGSKDLQVPAATNIKAIQRSFRKSANKQAIVKELPGLNHLFQECTTGSPSEYAQIEQTISPLALTTILDWIKETIK